MRRLAASLALGRGLAKPAGAGASAGNFTVNQFPRPRRPRTDVSVRYVLDMAEIPTFQRRQVVDANGDGRIGAGEMARERDRLSRSCRRTCPAADGRPCGSRSRTARRLPKGPGRAATTRLDALPRRPGSRSARGRTRVRFRTATPPIASAGASCWSRAATASRCARRTPAGDRTNALRTYPTDLLHSPPDVRSETTVAALGSGGLAVQAIPVARQLRGGRRHQLAKSDGGFAAPDRERRAAELLGRIAALGLATVFEHSRADARPRQGDGRRLAGTRGQRAPRTRSSGATVTVTHTAGVFALGLVTLSLSQFIVPDQLYPWLNLASGVMVVGIGAFAIRDRCAAGCAHAPDNAAPAARPRARARPARTRTTTGTITGTATRTPSRTSSPCGRSSRSASPAGCCRAPRRSSCCSRRSRCIAWPSASP